MIPISLTMTAFGPYLRETTVDFTRLGDRSLFLITGSTGGGKTSILDGMCFALYCRATGGRRGWTEMRCDSAADDQPTSVDFVFSLGKEYYRFRRSIRVHFVRGSGRREFREEHVCWKWKEEDGDWELWESGSETQVRRCAETLTGLTPEQFSQVIVLPQGDFLRLLRASSREKADMLRTLFSMTEWVKIQDALRERVKTLEKQVEKADSDRDALLQQSEAATPEELSEKLEILEQQKQTLFKQLGEKQREVEAAEQLLRRRRELTQARTRLLQEQAAEKEKQQQAETLQKRLEERKPVWETIPGLRQQSARASEQAARLESDLREVQQLEEVRKKLAQTRKEMETARRESQEAANAQQECRARLEKGQAFLEQIQQAADKLPALQERETFLRRGMEAFAALENAQKREEEKEKTILRQKQTLEEKTVSAKALSDSYRHQEACLRANQVLALSRQLREGEPCPVCGSVEHPMPATGEETLLNQEEMEKLRCLAEEAAASVSTQQGILKALEQELKTLSEETGIRRKEAEPYGSPETLRQELAQVEKGLQETREMAGKRLAAQKRLDTLNRELEQARNREADSGKALSGLSQREQEQKGREQELLAKWQGQPPEYEALCREKARLEEQARSLMKQAEKLEQERTELQNQHSGACTSLTDAQKRVRQARADCDAQEESWQGEIPDENQVSDSYQGKKRELDTLNQEAGQVSQRLSAGKSAAKRLQELEERFGNLQARYHQAARLYKLLSGSNPMRIPMDKYVLSIMLEEIISCANRYFARFSRERYALQRKQDRAAHNAYGGLDLEVLDGMTGHERSVDTLSGGEQFLASLSLALGLSEVVQNQSGCVRLEALFIDEGFGSLDQETLDTAMKALAMLHQGGRMIGIISHVSELRNRIPCRIEVSRLPDGSAKAEVVSELEHRGFFDRFRKRKTQ